MALAACLMVGYLVVGGYQDNVHKGQRIDHLIEQAQAADQAQAEADARASTERQALLANQRRLLRLYRDQRHDLQATVRRLDGLLAYLQAHGIQVPEEFQTGNLPGRRPSGGALEPSSTGNLPGSGGGGHGHPKGPGPTTSPTPTGQVDSLLTDLLDLLP